LVDLDLALKNSSSVFFKQLAKAMPLQTLRSLSLSSIVTRYKYLALFLRSCTSTLRFLTLDLVHFSKMSDYQAFFRFLNWETKLEDCVLRCLNIDSKGIRFSSINKQRPESKQQGWQEGCELDGEPWQYVRFYDDYSALELHHEDGDDIRFWLGEAASKCELGAEWRLDYDG
jgi:hypothetical protein